MARPASCRGSASNSTGANNGYATFEDYLSALNSRKRKAIKKERREALAGGIEIDLLTGSDLTEPVWDAFYKLYLGTTDRKWGSSYLNRKFFSLLGERLPDKVVLFMARRGGNYIAGAFNILGRETIYGRNWGAHREYRFLHFECCYYQAIEFAIDRGLKRVEAGAQGPHKLQRGYLPVPTYSAHWIPIPASAVPSPPFSTASATWSRRRSSIWPSIRPSGTRRETSRSVPVPRVQPNLSFPSLSSLPKQGATARSLMRRPGGSRLSPGRQF